MVSQVRTPLLTNTPTSIPSHMHCSAAVFRSTLHPHTNSHQTIDNKIKADDAEHKGVMVSHTDLSLILFPRAFSNKHEQSFVKSHLY